ncbi:MAG TPA: ASCH domain-containing protein [Gemmatimonadaceae bacterium]|nr:ASCH domain-containing protein [Gemmatimonadaceae bacterium]
MKGLTMTQPWATLVAIGENSIETRSWGTRYRGPLIIHSAKGFPRDARELCTEQPYLTVLARAGYRDASALPLGQVIAVAELVDVMKFTRTSLREVRERATRGEFPPHEAEFGDFSAGRYGWVLRNVRQVKKPISARGMLGLWQVPVALERAIRRQL